MKKVIHENIIVLIKTLITEAANLGTKESIVDMEALGAFDKLAKSEELTPAKGAVIKALWNDPGIKQTWDRRAEFQIVDSIKAYCLLNKKVRCLISKLDTIDN